MRRFFKYFIGNIRYLDSRVIHEEIERRKEKKVELEVRREGVLFIHVAGKSIRMRYVLQLEDIS